MSTTHEHGFSLIELLVAAAIFSFLVAGVTGLFAQALDIQRRGIAVQRIEENAQFVVESVAREVRVSRVTGGDTDCSTGPSPANRTLTIEHPVNGTVIYQYDQTGGTGVIIRNSEPITADDVDFTSFAFCIQGSGSDAAQARVTMPMVITSVGGRSSTRVSVSLQTTIASRDLSSDFGR